MGLRELSLATLNADNTAQPDLTCHAARQLPEAAANVQNLLAGAQRHLPERALVQEIVKARQPLLLVRRGAVEVVGVPLRLRHHRDPSVLSGEPTVRRAFRPLVRHASDTCIASRSIPARHSRRTVDGAPRSIQHAAAGRPPADTTRLGPAPKSFSSPSAVDAETRRAPVPARRNRPGSHRWPDAGNGSRGSRCRTRPSALRSLPERRCRGDRDRSPPPPPNTPRARPPR